MAITFALNKAYLAAFLVLLLVETCIGVYVRDDFIRPYLGDVLVVVLLYCFIKSFVRKEMRLLPLYLFLFAVFVEFGQFFDAAELLGLGDNRLARILIGSAFDVKDIICYFVGCAGLFLFDSLRVRPLPRAP